MKTSTRNRETKPSIRSKPASPGTHAKRGCTHVATPAELATYGMCENCWNEGCRGNYRRHLLFSRVPHGKAIKHTESPLFSGCPSP